MSFVHREIYLKYMSLRGGRQTDAAIFILVIPAYTGIHSRVIPTEAEPSGGIWPTKLIIYTKESQQI